MAQPALHRIEIEREPEIERKVEIERESEIERKVEIEKKAEISFSPEILEIANQASKLDKDGRQTILQIIRLVMRRGKSEEG